MTRPLRTRLLTVAIALVFAASAACSQDKAPTESPLLPERQLPINADAARRQGESDAGPSSGPAPGPRGRPDAAPAPVALNLSADLAAREQDARKRFGAKARTRVVQRVFLLVAVGRENGLFDQAAALIDRAVPPLLRDRFTRAPAAGVTVLLYSDGAAFRSYCAREYPHAGSDALGVYGPRKRGILADLSRGAAFLPTLTHELVHAILDTDFPFAPVWLEEGLASLFEAPVFTADGGIQGLPKNRRQPRLRAALASPRERPEVRLDAVFGMPADTFEARVDGGTDGSRRSLHYAMAREMMAWLDERGELWPFFHAWRDGFDADPTGANAFRAVVGKTPEEATAEWLRWVR